ncbi:MAG: hypothetical protein KJO98_13520 [Rhodothermia bacterium]|nr:hypothetical protein [Rhodothermia bacterium]
MTDHADDSLDAASDVPSRRPVFAWIGIACAILALPLARLSADVLVTREDPLGYYGLWTGLLTFLITLAIGIVCSGWSLLRKEEPRKISIIAAVANLALIAALLVFLA